MNEILVKLFGSSPKTTIIGYVSAAFTFLYPFFTTAGFDIKKDWVNIAIALGAALLGRLAKDSNGITKEQIDVLAEIAKKKLAEKQVVAALQADESK